jgi:hypothetical protein
VLALSGCYEDGYGYGGISAGYGSGGYYGYGDPYYGYGYGWYDGFYYPGRGYYIYDRGGKRHRWNDHHRHHWEGRRDHAGNWDGRRRDGAYAGDALRSPDRRGAQVQRNWRGQRDGQGQRSWRGRDDGARAAPPPRAEQSSDDRRGRGWRDRRGD